MTEGDRVIVLHQRQKSLFMGWGTVFREGKNVLGDPTVLVIFDHIPPNNRYGYPSNCVFPLYVIEEWPDGNS